MKTDEIYALSEQLSQQGVLLCFNGPFSHSLIQEFGQALRNHLRAQQAAGTVSSDVFAVYVEQAQNIQRYTAHAFAAPGDERFQHGIVTISRAGDRFAIGAGNHVLAADVDALRARIERVRGVDKPGLKAMHKQQLREEPRPGGGAGLGFIAMARVAAAPLEYAIRPVDEARSFFSLRVLI